jgi:V8-like Glu-specific endopeptidase
MTRTLSDARGAWTRLAAAVATAFALAAPATASAAPEIREAGDSARTAAEVRRYWTPKRMESAKPVKLLKADAPVPPAEEGGAGPTPRVGPIGYTSGELTDTLSFPNRVHGKVFFSRGGGDFVCSGTAVNAANLSTVITAGHCVRFQGQWASSVAFVPGYRNGSRPYGTWTATGIAAPSAWVSSEDLRHDVGAAVVAVNGGGQALQQVVGARGILFNQAVSGPVRSYGYPAQTPFDGSKLRYCDSTLGYRDPLTSNPQTMGIGCNMNGGSSGGGWVIGDPASGAVNSVNSYTRLGVPEVMHGPYFGSTAQALYNGVNDDPPGGPGAPAAGPGAIAQGQQQVTAPQAKCKKPKKKRAGKRKRCKPTRQG